MPNLNLDKTIREGSSIAEIVFLPHTEQKYEHLVELLDSFSTTPPLQRMDINSWC